MVPLPGKLSALEEEVIEQIRVLRASPEHDLNAILRGNPTRILHHFILLTHGHVALRLGRIARELGVEMKTLQRRFLILYKKTPLQCQLDTRLSFSKWLLRMTPPAKIATVANMLGYKEVRDFNRFFRKHVHQSPSEWGRAERLRLERETQDRREVDECQ